jgi:hypothetical protein
VAAPGPLGRSRVTSARLVRRVLRVLPLIRGNRPSVGLIVCAVFIAVGGLALGIGVTLDGSSLGEALMSSESTTPADDLPAYLRQMPTLLMRVGNRLVPASPEDLAVAQQYPTWSDKGPLLDGRRLTLLTRSMNCAVGEPVRVIHALEVIGTGMSAAVAGPKPILGEYVDSVLATLPAPAEDPFVPPIYDGPMVSSPVVDFNYEITVYTFSTPGQHTIQWRIGPLRSNTLTLEVGVTGK